MSPTMMKP